MGLFNNYLKEGPGVDVNAPKKKGIFLFIEVFGRKFLPLMKANVLYFLFSIPMLAVLLLFIAPQYTAVFIGIDGIEKIAKELGTQKEMLLVTYNLIFTGLIFNLFGSGPASAAYAYVTRSFTRSEPVWVWSDGVDKFKENFKYSILLAVIDIVVLYIASVAIAFYGASSGMGSSFLHMFVIVILIIYAMAHSFAYQIIVTYECKFTDVIKNSFVLTLAKLPMCVLLFVITTVLCAVVFNFGTLGIIAYALLGMSLIRFPLEFYAARVIEKNIEKMNTQGDNE